MKIPKQISERTKIFTGALFIIASYIIVMFVYDKVDADISKIVITYEVEK